LITNLLIKAIGLAANGVISLLLLHSIKQKHMGKPVYLTGYMGSGKTTVGKKLARQLDYDFVDTDELIVTMAGKSVQAIFDSEGEDAFRLLEHSVLKSLANRINTVISTGGGTPCFFNNMQIMKKTGIVIYLKMHPASILKRLKVAKNPRPLLRNIPEDQLLPFITNQLSQREQFYLNAHFTVKGESLDIDEVVKTVKGLRS